jgi:hypothetical protein
MDHLSEAFARLSVLRSSSAVSVYQGGDGGVYCGAPIAAGTVLGRIRGRPAYIWELEHERYMIVDRDYVLDVSGATAPEDWVTWVREENATWSATNCEIATDDDGATFFLRAKADVPAHTELVYFGGLC